MPHLAEHVWAGSGGAGNAPYVLIRGHATSDLLSNISSSFKAPPESFAYFFALDIVGCDNRASYLQYVGCAQPRISPAPVCVFRMDSRHVLKQLSFIMDGNIHGVYVQVNSKNTYSVFCIFC